MALTPEEESLLLQLEAEESALSQSQASNLTPEEEIQLQQLEAEELGLQQLSQRDAETALQSGADVATLGYLPQLQAAGGKIIEALTPEDETTRQLREQGFNIEDQPRSFVEQRDVSRQRLGQLQEANPVASAIGTGTGAIVSGIATGGAASAVGKAIPGAAKLATAAQAAPKIAGAAKIGGEAALIGFLQNPGDVEGELSGSQFSERLKNTKYSVVSAAITAGGLKGIGAAAKKIKGAARSLKSFAELKSFKAAGGMIKDYRKHLTGEFTKDEVDRKINKISRVILDNNVMQVGDDINGIANNAAILKEAAGETIGEIYSASDEALSQAVNNPRYAKLLEATDLDMEMFAKLYKKQLVKNVGGLAGESTIIPRIAKELDSIAKNGKVTLKRLQKIRQSIDEQINFAKATTEVKGTQRELLRLRNKLQDIAKRRVRAADKIRGTKDTARLIKANEEFSALKDIADMSGDKAIREEANAAFGMRERQGGIVGSVIGMAGGGGVLSAAAGAALGTVSVKAARQYGTPIIAKTADKTARLLERNPELLGKFADPLIKAAEDGTEAFVRTVSFLRSDPEFKKKVRAARRNERR